MGYLFGLAGSLISLAMLGIVLLLAIAHWAFILRVIAGLVIGLIFHYWGKHIRWTRPIQPYHTDIFLRGSDLEKRLVRQLAWLGYTDIKSRSRFKLTFVAEFRGYRLGFNCCGELTLTELQKNAQALTALYLDEVIIATTHPISKELRVAARKLHVTLWDEQQLAKLPLVPPTDTEPDDVDY
ncbi:hypothetical protein [Levilactobacillus acidifarinae]|uniref:Restriction endonuclease type IV Mrr domain-containing protein n=1 Tax=Levilactobacillus acidifarinae DSM 19394 = JCM 15949 TaxID=1423715 RepID=A0A0R1LQN5_9LACO|nr:hypothetical protein [Levilactobacillus acidifarinae]KRK94402.1 hypothetical protein FD25_GL000362 [Levilactobacillus acidifarinae DSM 19394]GEO68142.1 hypothetical protein LAC03_00520 [Levilactobacillus acidifarinae]